LNEAKYRVKFTKTDEAKWISHLDLARYLERSLRRADLPIAYSNGFSPHPKISFGQALSVGIESRAEYVDLTLEKEKATQEIQDRLSKVTSEAIRVLNVIKLGSESRKLGKALVYADYQISIGIGSTNIDRIKNGIYSSTYLTSEGIKITSEESDNICMKNSDADFEGKDLLIVTIRMPVNISPKNILKELQDIIALDDASIDITRIAQWSKAGQSLVDPIEVEQEVAVDQKK